MVGKLVTQVMRVAINLVVRSVLSTVRWARGEFGQHVMIPAVHAMEQATKLEKGVQTGLWQMGEPIARKPLQKSRVVILYVQLTVPGMPGSTGQIARRPPPEPAVHRAEAIGSARELTSSVKLTVA